MAKENCNMITEQNKIIIRRYFDSQNQHNLEAAFSYFSPNIHSHNVPGSQGPVGIEEIKAYFVMLHDAIPDLQATLHDSIGEGDKVAVRFTVSGTQAKEFMGQPAGQPVTLNILTIYRIEDGKIAEVWS